MSEMSQVYVGIYHVQCPLLLSDFKNVKFLDRFTKNTHVEFLKNPSGVSKALLCGRTDMTKPVIAFHTFVSASVSLTFRILDMIVSEEEHGGGWDCTAMHQ
jgi:hypothetical protein